VHRIAESARGSVARRPKLTVAAAVAVVAAVLSGCETAGEQGAPEPAASTATTTTTTTAAKPKAHISKTKGPARTKTVYVQPPRTKTVYVPQQSSRTPASEQWYAQPEWIDSQPWIEITPAAGQTPCQWLYANGYSYPEAFAAWAQRGYPPNWSATNDGYPCQRSYGMQN